MLDTVVYKGIAALCLRNDQKVIDGGIDRLSQGTIQTGGWLSLLHSAMIQFRLLVIFAVMTLLGAYLII